MDTVEAWLGDAAEEAGGQGTGGRLTHDLVLVTNGQDQHTGGGAEAGEVPRAHGTLDEVVAQRADVGQHDGVERPVQTQRHQERVEQGDDDREDDRGARVEPRQSGTQACTDPDTRWTDDEGRHRHHDDEGEERNEHHLHVGGNELGQTLVDQGQDGHHHEGNEDLAAVVVELHGNARDMRDTQVLVQRGVVGACRSQCLAEVKEWRRHQRRHDRGADPGVDVELLGGVVGHHDGQEVEHRLVHGLSEDLCGGLVRGRQVRITGIDDAERIQYRKTGDDERGAQQHRQQGAEGVREVLEEGVDLGVLATGLGAGSGLDVGVGLT